MIQEGRFIEDEFNLAGRIYTRHYPTFEFQLIIGEYDVYEYPNTFFEDLKNAFEHFKTSFNFIKLGKVSIVGSVFGNVDDIRFTGEGAEIVYRIFERFDEEKLKAAFDYPDPEEVFVIYFGQEYQSIEENTCLNDNGESVLFLIQKENQSNQLVCDFRWGSGAEWFYNKYKEENRAIVRKAIIDFYESSPNYQELRVGYYLYGFDLEVEKYTQKKTIVRKNTGAVKKIVT